MKTVKIFLVLSDLYNEQTSSVLEQLELGWKKVLLSYNSYKIFFLQINIPSNPFS